ncbi:MAG: hypothetical protein BWY80_00627 [Firmicutes bacterium ADurb.Bin456]|nr:MAG: hypothetical protein BWY80_00627 [Firmicutes bacterium ADurb.Bin456]
MIRTSPGKSILSQAGQRPGTFIECHKTYILNAVIVKGILYLLANIISVQGVQDNKTIDAYKGDLEWKY